MRIALLQTSGLEEVFCTLPIIQSLKKKHPDSELTFFVRNQWKAYEPLFDIGPSIVFLSGEPSASAIGNDPFDLLINCSFSLESAKWALLIPAREKRGLLQWMHEGQESLVVPDRWSQFIYASTFGAGQPSFHFTDSLLHIAGQALEKKTSPSLPLNEGNYGIFLDSSSIPWGMMCAEILKLKPDCKLHLFGEERIIEETMDSILECQPFSGEIHRLMRVLPHQLDNEGWDDFLAAIKQCQVLIGARSPFLHLTHLHRNRCIQICSQLHEATLFATYGNDHGVIVLQSLNRHDLVRSLVSMLEPKEKIEDQKNLCLRTAQGIDQTLHHLNLKRKTLENFFEKSYYLLAYFRCEGLEIEIETPLLHAKGTLMDDSVNHYMQMLKKLQRAGQLGRRVCAELEDEIDHSLRQLSALESVIKDIHALAPLLGPLIQWWKLQKDATIIPQESSMSTRERMQRIQWLTEGAYRELEQNCEILLNLFHLSLSKGNSKEFRNEKNQN